MSDKITISPGKDRAPRHPGGQRLEARSEVERSTFWNRLLDAGDVVLVQPKTEKKDS